MCGVFGLVGLVGADSASSATKKKGWSFRQAQRFHKHHVVLDLHADTLYQMMRGWVDLGRFQRARDLDIPKLRRGGVSAQVFVMWVPPKKTRGRGQGWQYIKKMYAAYRRMLREHADVFEHAKWAHDIRRIQKKGKIAALLAIEGAHPFEGKLSHARTAIKWGLTYVGLTWNNSNAFATSALDERYRRRKRKGLTRKGRRLVRLLEKHRVLVDLSHAGRQTFWDVAKIAKRPFIASHSNAYRLRKHFRNLTDKQLLAIKKCGGVVGINFYTAYLRRHNHRKATIRDLLRHVLYIKKKIGVRHLALGSDYDGLITKPKGLQHIGYLPILTASLRGSGFSRRQLSAMLGENVLRLLAK
tara:strand:- start:5170 stop:6237 length:1068 start_codon:yes stop_codon:yes gene_type:complete